MDMHKCRRGKTCQEILAEKGEVSCKQPPEVICALEEKHIKTGKKK